MRMIVWGLVAALAGTVALAEEDVRSVRWSAARASDPFGSGILGVAEVEFGGVKAMVRCSSSPARVEVRFFLDRSLVAGSQAVGWRFDDRDRNSMSWSKSPNGQSLVVPPDLQERFMEQLKIYDTLVLYLADGQGAEHEVMVPLRGSSAAITRALRWCDEA